MKALIMLLYQHMATGASSLANLLPSPSNSKTLNSEHDVYIYLNDLEKVYLSLILTWYKHPADYLVCQTQPDLCIL